MAEIYQHVADAMGFANWRTDTQLHFKVPFHGEWALYTPDGKVLPLDKFCAVDIGETYKILNRDGEGIEVSAGPTVRPVLTPRELSPYQLDTSLPIQWGIHKADFSDAWAVLIDVAKYVGLVYTQLDRDRRILEKVYDPDRAVDSWLSYGCAREWMVNRLNIEVGTLINDIAEGRVDDKSAERLDDIRWVSGLLKTDPTNIVLMSRIESLTDALWEILEKE